LIKFRVAVPRSEDDKKLELSWWNRAFCARYRPIRIKITVEEIEGEECSLVLEHVFRHYQLERKKDSDLGFFFFDNPNTFRRHYVHIQPPAYPDREVVKIGSNAITPKTLEKAVYQALKTGKTEVDINIRTEDSGGEYEWDAYALVDVSCQRVYAFKIVLVEGRSASPRRFGCIGYTLCPSYGETVEQTRPISYATELVKLPPLEPYTMPEYPQDDDVDDRKPPVPSVVEAPPPSSSNATSPIIPPELNARLVSIDTNLERIANALEKLVAVLPGLPGNGQAR